MTFDELNDYQRIELKQRILAERNDAKGDGMMGSLFFMSTGEMEEEFG